MGIFLLVAGTRKGCSRRNGSTDGHKSTAEAESIVAGGLIDRARVNDDRERFQFAMTGLPVLKMDENSFFLVFFFKAAYRSVKPKPSLRGCVRRNATKF